jgi:putative polyhydroxyalkanoate system protein
MADISITQTHKLSHKKAKAAAQKVADKMAEEYDMSSEWQGDVLTFKRSGVSGTLEVYPTEAKLEITLGFLFKAFSTKIEEQVHKKMEKVFSSKA